MARTKFTESRKETGKKTALDSKRGFKTKEVLTDCVFGLRKTAGKFWRWAYLSTPFIAACSTSDEKLHSGTVSLATVGGLAAGMGIIWGCVEGIKAIARHVKNKKENKKD